MAKQLKIGSNFIEVLLIEVLMEELGHVEKHGTWHGRIDGAEEVLIGKVLAVVVAREHHSLLHVTLSRLEVLADRKCGDYVGEALLAVRCVVGKLVLLNKPTVRFHFRYYILIHIKAFFVYQVLYSLLSARNTYISNFNISSCSRNSLYKNRIQQCDEISVVIGNYDLQEVFRERIFYRSLF